MSKLATAQNGKDLKSDRWSDRYL